MDLVNLLLNNMTPDIVITGLFVLVGIIYPFALYVHCKEIIELPSKVDRIYRELYGIK